MAGNDLTMLREAIVRNTAVAVTMGGAGGGADGRSRFLSVAGDGIWLESWGATAGALKTLIAGDGQITINFRQDTQKVEFVARPLEHRMAYQLNANTYVQAVRIEAPASVKAVQRRENYRVAVPTSSSLVAKFWRLADHEPLADVPGERAEVTLSVRDLSAGGMGGVYAPKKGETLKLVDGQRLRIEFAHEAVNLLLDGRLRFTGKLPNSLNQRVGVQFRLQTADMADRLKGMQLEKIIGQLQRLELRRKKLK